ncbi:MAG: hypothetical protein ACRCTS_03705 [Fusobacteriaceae bacterium]
MENILYFNKKTSFRNKSETGRFYLGIPVVKKDILIYLEEKKLNIFQEIILKLCYKGKKTLEELNDVLKLQDMELIEYIRSELVKLKYLNGDYDLTPEGEEALKSEVQEIDIKRGTIYYNLYTGDYLPGIHIENEKFEEIETEYKHKDEKKINFGTVGDPNFQRVEFQKVNFPPKELEINDFFEIVKIELEFLRIENDKSLYVKERIENLENICKIKQGEEVTGHILYCLSWDEENKKISLETPFKKEGLEEELTQKLLKENKIRKKITEEYELITSLDKAEQKIEKEENKKQIEYVENKSGGIFKKRPNLIRALSEICFDLVPKKEDSSKFVDSLYKTLTEILAYHIDNLDIKNNLKISNIEYEEILKKKFKLKKDSSEYNSLRKKLDVQKLKKGLTNNINKDLYSLLGYSMIAEDGSDEEKIFKYTKERKDFFELVGLLIKLRNSKDHHSGQDETENESIDLYMELREFVLETVKKLSGVNLDLKDRIERDHEKYSKIRESSFEKLKNLEFKGIDYFKYEKELLDIETSFQMFNQLGSITYKYQILKKIGILVEKNLKELGQYIRKDSIVELQDMKDSYIKFEEIAKHFFPERESDNFCSEEIKKLKKYQFTLNKNKVENLFRRFEMGTLNNYTAALLYSSKKASPVLSKLIKELPEFFEFPFVISNYRGHNGETDFSDEKLKEIIYFTYKLQIKYINEMKKYEN